MKAWPVTLQHDRLRLRPLHTRDATAWSQVQLRNRDWLQSWEATVPDGDLAPSFGSMVRSVRRQARDGRALPFALEVDGRFRGQVSVSSVTWGSFRSASIGYWIDQEVAGRGYMPCAVALVVDHCLAWGLHRLEVNIRPENVASLAVARKLRLREEGLRQRFLHIDGGWRDHLSFAVTAEEVLEGMHQRVHAARDGGFDDLDRTTRA